MKPRKCGTPKCALAQEQVYLYLRALTEKLTVDQLHTKLLVFYSTPRFNIMLTGVHH
jgi:hypothetical protein